MEDLIQLMNRLGVDWEVQGTFSKKYLVRHKSFGKKILRGDRQLKEFLTNLSKDRNF